MKGLCIMFFLLFTLICTFHHSSAQSADIQRLRTLVSVPPQNGSQAPDSTYLNALIGIARAFYGVNADSAFFYGKKALAYAETTNDEKGKADSWRMIGNTYEMIGDYQNMLSSYHRSKLVAEQMGSESLIAKVNLNIALFYKQMGEYDEALKHLGNINNIYKDYDDSTQLAYVLSHYSDISFYRHEYDKALEYANHAVAVSRALKDSLAIASFTNDIGKILTAKGQYMTAITMHIQSMNYFKRIDDKLGMTETTTFLANAYLQQKDYTNALHYGLQSLELAMGLHRKKEIKESGKVLADIYQAKGDDHSALRYYQLYKAFSDSLFNEQTRKQTFALEARYEYEKKEDSLQTVALKKDILRQHLDRNHTQQILIAALLIVFLSVVAFVLLRNKGINKKNTELLVAKNQEIELQKEAIEHQAVQLLLNNQQKDKLFSIIAHDLKGPLNSLKGLMDLLKEHTLPESEIRSMMAELSRNVGYSSELVGNLLFWASSQLDGIVISPVALPLRQLTNEIFTLFARQASEKNISLINNIGADNWAYGDKDMTQVILRNLLNNAIKFCRSGDTITITSQKNGDRIEICVADTGIGIKEDVLDKIRRKESVTTYGTAKEKGTGLGMLLCREFVEANNGNFRVDSEWGKGSWFYFTIPVAASSSSINV